MDLNLRVRLQPAGEERIIAAGGLRWGPPGKPGCYLIHEGRTVSGAESREHHLPYVLEGDGPWCRLVIIVGQATEGDDVLDFDRSRLPRRAVSEPGVEVGEPAALSLRHVGPGEERELGDLAAAFETGMGGAA